MRNWIVAAGIGLAAFAANAQSDYPNHPIRFVLVSSAGGGGDAIARMISDKMAPMIKGSFFIDNKPGAGGAIATEIVAKAPADGYTILLGGYTTHVLLPTVNPKLPYNPVKDFMPVGQIGTASILFVATNDFPANNLKEFIALAKSKPGLQYASWGNGSTGHFCGELLRQKMGLDISHVAYKSVGQIQNDMLGGHIKLGFVDMATGSPMVKAGRVKALGACTSRSPSLPELGSYEDEGIDSAGKRISPPMWAIYAPTGTPKPILDKLSAALKATVEMPDVKARLLDLGITPGYLPGTELRENLAASIDAWKPVAQTGNITME